MDEKFTKRFESFKNSLASLSEANYFPSRYMRLNFMYYQLAQQEFESYLNGYDRENDRIKLKIIHTYGVVKQA